MPKTYNIELKSSFNFKIGKTYLFNHIPSMKDNINSYYGFKYMGTSRITGGYIFTTMQEDKLPLSTDYGFYINSRNYISITNCFEIYEVIDHMLIAEEARRKYEKTTQEVMMGIMLMLDMNIKDIMCDNASKLILRQLKLKMIQI